MGLFSSKKKTFSGVGSAVQNMLDGDVEDVLTTTVVSATLAKENFADAFIKNLKDGSGRQLIRLMDYAQRHNYNSLLGWNTTKLRGEVFNNSSDYVSYLTNLIYPSSSAETQSEPKEIASTEPISRKYYRGEDEYEDRRFTRTKEVATTDDNDSYSVNVLTYYQGSNTAFLALNQIIADSGISFLDKVDESSTTLQEQFYVAVSTTKFEKLKQNLSVIILDEQKGEDVELTSDKTLYLASNDAFDNPDLENLNEGETEAKAVTGSELFLNDVAALAQIRQDFLEDGITELELDSSKPSIQVVNVAVMMNTYCDRTYEEIPAEEEEPTETETDTETETEETNEEEEPKEPEKRLVKAEAHGAWVFGKAILIVASESKSSKKNLVASVEVTHTKTKTTSLTTTEYSVREIYKNGELISSEEVEGASNTETTTDVLLDEKSTHNENYVYGSGNEYLDAILDNTKSFQDSFCPILPIKRWGNLSDSSWGALYNAERKLYRKITNKPLSAWDKLVESFSNLEANIKNVVYFPSVPINVDETYSNQYLFYFFKWLAVNFGGMAACGTNINLDLTSNYDTDFQLKYNFYLRYQILSGEPPIPCKPRTYARYVVLGSEPEDQTSLNWEGEFMDWNRLATHSYSTTATNYSFSLNAEDYPNLSEEEFKKLQESNKFTVLKNKVGSTSLTIYFRISENLYERVYITNFTMFHLVRGSALTYYLKNSIKNVWHNDDSGSGLSPIIIPLTRGALESMGWYQQAGLTQICHNIVISGFQQQTVKVKWYQRGIFKVIMVVVIIVVSIYCAPAGGAMAGAGAGVGATVSALATMALKAVAIALIARAVTYAANKWIGGTVGRVVGTVGAILVTIYCSYQFGMMGNVNQNEGFWESMNTFQGYMKLTDALVTNTNGLLTERLQNKAKDVQADYANFQNEKKAKEEELKTLENTMASWDGNKSITDIIAYSSYTSSTQQNGTLLAEDPDTFYNRVFDLDFYDLNTSYVDDFEDYQLNTELS